MRRAFLIAIIMATMFIASSGEASAARYSQQRQSVATRRFRPFAKLIELERRKTNGFEVYFSGVSWHEIIEESVSFFSGREIKITLLARVQFPLIESQAFFIAL